jgi:hypothetical protein
MGVDIGRAGAAGLGGTGAGAGAGMARAVALEDVDPFSRNSGDGEALPGSLREEVRRCVLRVVDACVHGKNVDDSSLTPTPTRSWSSSASSSAASAKEKEKREKEKEETKEGVVDEHENRDRGRETRRSGAVDECLLRALSDVVRVAEGRGW